MKLVLQAVVLFEPQAAASLLVAFWRLLLLMLLPEKALTESTPVVSKRSFTQEPLVNQRSDAIFMHQDAYDFDGHKNDFLFADTLINVWYCMDWTLTTSQRVRNNYWWSPPCRNDRISNDNYYRLIITSNIIVKDHNTTTNLCYTYIGMEASRVFPDEGMVSLAI